MYLAMGWLSVLVARPVGQHLDRATSAWIVAGGLIYTAGRPF